MLGKLEQFLEHQRPNFFLWTPVLIGAGIACYFSLRFEPELPVLLVLPVLAALCIGAGLARDLAVRVGLASMILFLFGLGLASWRAHAVQAPVLTQDYFGAVEGRVIGISRSASNRVRLTLDDVILYGVEPSEAPARVRISLSKSAPTDQAGQRILVYARLSGPNGPVEPDGFDFRRMAWFSQLGGIGYALGPVLPSMNPQDQTAAAAVLQVRMKLSHALTARISGAEGGFASAILTGDRSHIDPASLADLRASNLAHLLAISGLHMGLLTGLIFSGVRIALALFPGFALRRPTKKIAAIAALLAGLAYLVLSGASVATQRAYVMAVVVFVAVLLDRPAFTLRGVALAALIILIIRPESLTGAGFQMSFAATIGLVSAFDVLRHQSWWRAAQTRPGRLAKGVFVVAFTSAVAGLATAPISAFHFNQVAQYGLLANVLAVPVMGFVIMPGAILGIIMSPLGLDAIPFWVAGQGIGIVLDVAHWVAHLENSLIHVPMGPAAALGCIVMGCLLLTLLLGRARLAGTGLIALGAVLWMGSERPDILIDPTARLVGIKTPDGRVLTRSRGAGYAASTWLENDGDPSSQKIASKRLDHLSDKDQAQLLWLSGFETLVTSSGGACSPGKIVLLEKGQSAKGGCTAFDAAMLSATGSVAVWFEKGQPRVVTAAERIGRRLWVAERQ